MSESETQIACQTPEELEEQQPWVSSYHSSQTRSQGRQRDGLRKRETRTELLPGPYIQSECRTGQRSAVRPKRINGLNGRTLHLDSGHNPVHPDTTPLRPRQRTAGCGSEQKWYQFLVRNAARAFGAGRRTGRAERSNCAALSEWLRPIWPDASSARRRPRFAPCLKHSVDLHFCCQTMQHPRQCDSPSPHLLLKMETFLFCALSLKRATDAKPRNVSDEGSIVSFGFSFCVHSLHTACTCQSEPIHISSLSNVSGCNCGDMPAENAPLGCSLTQTPTRLTRPHWQSLAAAVHRCHHHEGARYPPIVRKDLDCLARTNRFKTQSH